MSTCIPRPGITLLILPATFVKVKKGSDKQKFIQFVLIILLSILTLLGLCLGGVPECARKFCFLKIVPWNKLIQFRCRKFPLTKIHMILNKHSFIDNKRIQLRLSCPPPLPIRRGFCAKIVLKTNGVKLLCHIVS